jgi:hypothetical protein
MISLGATLGTERIIRVGALAARGLFKHTYETHEREKEEAKTEKKIDRAHTTHLTHDPHDFLSHAALPLFPDSS